MSKSTLLLRIAARVSEARRVRRADARDCRQRADNGKAVARDRRLLLCGGARRALTLRRARRGDADGSHRQSGARFS